MHNIDQIIRAVIGLLDVVLLGCLAYRRLAGRFALFFAYLLCSTAGLMVESWLAGNTVEYYVTHWIIQAIESTVSFALIIWIFWPAIELVHRRLGAPGFILPLTVLALIDFSFWRTVHHSFGQSWLGLTASSIYSFDLAISFIEFVIWLLALWLRRHYRKIWSRYSMDIIAGLAAMSLASLMAYGTRLGFGNKFEIFFRYLPSLASILISLIWIITFSRPEPEDLESTGSSDPKAFDDVLRKAAEILDRTERIIRRGPFRLSHL